MKTTLLFCLMIIFGKGCHSDWQKGNKDLSFEYETLTRGFYNKIIVKKDTVFVIHDMSMEKITVSKVSKNDWDELQRLLKKVDVDAIEKMKASTANRATDRALHADLKLIYEDKTYKSNTFDAGNPPKEIEGIVNKMIAISNKK